MHSALPIAALRTTTALNIAPHRQHVLHRDAETRSSLLLKLVGPHRYASGQRTEILCLGYALDDQPVKLWTSGNPVPPEFIEAARNPDWIVAAHNDNFETAIEQHILKPHHGFPLIPLQRHVCTMAMSLALGLPARLDAVADALELAHRKDAAGQRLMLQMVKPRRARKDEDATATLFFDDDERLQRLCEYCMQDVEVEREL
jgi:DNA polymerase bacteriophage-type